MREDRSEPSRGFICPICKRTVSMPTRGTAGLPKFFPFCSERCKLIDLGAWLDADYRIPAKPDEESEESPGEPPSPSREEPPQ
jgi:uncharacterized protein